MGTFHRPAKLHLIAGARPNFMKIAPLWHALKDAPDITPVFVHTGQHTNSVMSSEVWRDLGLPAPDHHLMPLGAGQITERPSFPNDAMRAAYKTLCQADRPDAVLVVGDVSSALACATVAHELAIPLIHLEAGLGSFDARMIEETNRIEIDHLSDLLLTPSPDADQNLIREGIATDRIVRVGNIMMDSLERQRPAIEAARMCGTLGVEHDGYGLVTLHRPENVDDPKRLMAIMGELEKLAERQPIVFPVHPRTQNALRLIGRRPSHPQTALQLCEPLPYAGFISLVLTARFVVTDSGGLQEETSYLGVDCFTLRDTTERPVTVTHGTNKLVTLNNMISTIQQRDPYDLRRGASPIDLWDGKAATRVVVALRDFIARMPRS